MISVVIPTLGRTKDLRTCIESIALQKNDVDYEIVVVINGNFNATKKEVEKLNFKNLRYCIEKRRGINFARNKGVEVAKGDLIAFIDDDAVASDDWITRISNHLKKETNVFGGPITNQNSGRLISEIHQKIFEKNMAAGDNRMYFNISGSNMIFSRRVFDSVGPFDTDYLYGSSETEFLERVSKEFEIFFDERVVVSHKWNPSLFAFLRNNYIMGREQKKYLNKIQKKNGKTESYWIKDTLRISGSLNSYHKYIAPVPITLGKILFALGCIA